MKTMSNVDIFTISQELHDLLEGARVDKSFQPGKDTVIIRFHVKGVGRVDVVFQAGVRMHKTQYPLLNPKIPPSFPMLLRKHLKGANVVFIKQHYFDRVVEIKIKKDQSYTLIIELFSKGNIILLNEKEEIILPLKRKKWSDRDISSKKKYLFPPKKGINPLNIEKKDLSELFKNSEDDLIRTLAKNGLGGTYSEEIVLRSKIDKKIPANELNDYQINKIYDSFLEIFTPLKENKFKPNIISNGKENLFPIELELYKDYKHRYFDNFNEAADEFYSKRVKNDIREIQEATWKKKVGKYSKRLKIQKETLEGFKKTIKISKKKGDLLYTHYLEIESLLKVVHDARSKEYSWMEISKTLSEAKKNGMKEVQVVESMDKLGNLILDIEGEKIAIDSKISLPENAQSFYEKGKKAKRKTVGANIAIEKTKKQLKEMEEKKEIAMENIMVPQKRVKKELKWFEKLRWFLSSDGNLVVGGRDANTNEAVVKKYLDNNDIYMHSDIHGASSVAIKGENKEFSDNTLKESAVFAASFSSAWSKGYGTQDVFWVKSEQVSKTPESGEFVAKGSFIIRGHRNFIRGAILKIAIGIVDFEGKRVMAGPVDAVKKYTDKYMIVKPGYVKKEAIAKKILHEINKDNIISLDDIVRVLPSGKCEIIEE
ncbi:MAG: NFACT family protein [Methanobacteriaceae archaeon]|jgi:predicted ribosome quality control (RQC) complex YloA/Tae2 family protein|nr:NFACT family protein [Candidatus Methanorudis spinitermitis]